MTRVLAFCDYFEPPMGGGAEIVSAEVYQRLTDTNEFSVTVISGVPGRRPSSTATRSDETGVRVVRSRSLDLSRLLGVQLSIAPGLPVAALRVVNSDKPDVIHASSIHFFGSLFAAAIAKLKRIPLVTTCHLSGLDALPSRTRALAGAYERTCGKFILRRSDTVIAVSEAVRDHLVTLGVDPAKIEVIENGVDHDRFRPGERDHQSVQVCFVGRLIANKGPMELLDAFATLESGDARLLLVGSGPLLEQAGKRAAQIEKAQVLGQRDDVAEILSHSDIFVRPSATEGRSLAILEAMAAGCAVVASDIPANAELVEHGRTGLLFPPGDVAALRDALSTLINDHEMRDRFGANARARTTGSTWETTSVATGEVLRTARSARAS